MGIGIVVLLPDEDHVGGRQVGEHHFEIGEGVLARIEDALGNICRHGCRRRGTAVDVAACATSIRRANQLMVPLL